MPSSTVDDQIHYLAVLHEVLSAPGRIIAHLSAAGFDDIPEHGPSVLGAIAMSRDGGTELIKKLNVTEQAASQTIEALAQRGYLELSAGPDGADQPTIAMTDRGRVLAEVIQDSIKVGRWADFPMRQGDIVISSPAKSGTTWVQMICALLVFQTPDLPAPLPDLSPWMEPLGISRNDIYDRLAAQEHRRFIKAHLPLSEIPIDSGVTYIALARDPLDSAISLFHQRDSATKARMNPSADPPAPPARPAPPATSAVPAPPAPVGRGRPPGPSPRDYLLRWIAAAPRPQVRRQSLPGVMCHLSDAWARRAEPNVVLVHYDDLLADLEREMRRLAARLGITVPETKWPRLVKAATLEQMRTAADRIQPLPTLKDDPAAYFRRGTSGSGRELLTSTELARYHTRAAQLAPSDLLAWLFRQDGAK